MTHQLKKILIIGSGAREHALVKAFKKNQIYEIHIAPGNDGIGHDAKCHPEVNANDSYAILNLCKKNNFSFVFVGPEDPLVGGLTDLLRAHNIPAVGPSQKAAQLEGSKIFAKDFMQEAGIPCARSENILSYEDLQKKLLHFKPPYVFKYDGLAAGKGVVICQSQNEVLDFGHKVFNKKIFADEKPKAILEQHLSGYELSYIFITNGTEYSALPIAQDHKRLFDDDLGPNTGGMGTVAPLQISNQLLNKIENEIIEPTLQTLQKRNLEYFGIVFLGLMIQDNQPYLLEYNVRLGDPETQVLLPLVKNNLVDVFFDLSKGVVQKLEFNNLFASCIVAAAENYPEAPIKGAEIKGDIFYSTDKAYILSASAKFVESKWVTNGGRVLSFVGFGDSLSESLAQAYSLSEKIHWKNIQIRSDIGKKVITSPNS